MTHGAFHLLWWLIVGHALADFVLQSSAMAAGKNRHHQGRPGEPPWYYWLVAHALIHGGVVGIVTGSAGLGVAEFVAHGLIDFGKCEGVYGFNTDQAFHLVCKLFWISIVGGI
jgi:Protein of unknown function (DUF3307)